MKLTFESDIHCLMKLTQPFNLNQYGNFSVETILSNFVVASMFITVLQYFIKVVFLGQPKT